MMFSKTKYIIIGLLTCFFLVSPDGQILAKENSAGKVLRMEGSVIIVRGGKELNALVNTKIFQADVIKTGPDSLVELLMQDGSSLHLGPESHFELSQFKFNLMEDNPSFVAKMAKGIFVYISGAISKVHPEAIKFETPNGTIGIRGTKLVVIVKSTFDAVSKEKVFLLLFKDPTGKVGEVRISNSFGSKILNNENYLVTVNWGDAPTEQKFISRKDMEKMLPESLYSIIFGNYKPPLPYTPVESLEGLGDFFKIGKQTVIPVSSSSPSAPVPTSTPGPSVPAPDRGQGVM